jgi:hypothetical protein
LVKRGDVQRIITNLEKTAKNRDDAAVSMWTLKTRTTSFFPSCLTVTGEQKRKDTHTHLRHTTADRRPCFSIIIVAIDLDATNIS